MNIGKTQYKAGAFVPNSHETKEYKQYNTLLAWSGLRLHPGPLSGAHSNPVAQVNQGSKEPSCAELYMQMQTIANTKTIAHGEAPQSGC